MQTLDILVDGPQADLIREEAIALRAESGLIPGQQGVEVASAAAQSEHLEHLESVADLAGMPILYHHVEGPSVIPPTMSVSNPEISLDT